MNWSLTMYLHKEDKELFRDIILLTSQKLGISEDIVEKDYYVTLILKKVEVFDGWFYFLNPGKMFEIKTCGRCTFWKEHFDRARTDRGG